MSQIGPPTCVAGQASAVAPVACSAATQRWVLVTAILGSSMAFVDGTVVNVAVPAIQRSLQATAFQAQWVIEAYALLLAALLLVGGALGDRHGRKRVFQTGVLLFALASAACGLAPNVGALIAARAVQGVGAALLVPGSLALISAAYGEQERGRAIGLWSGFSGVTAALGPVLGGYLVDHVSWAWAFYLNLPPAAVVLWITARHVPESYGAHAKAPVDAAGALLAALGLAGVVYAFIEAPVQGWQAWPVQAALGGGALALGLFVAVEWRTPAPMLPLHLFRERDFTGANLLTLLLYAALGGGLYFLPLNLIQVQGLSAAAAGAALLPFVLIMFLLSGWAGALVERVGPKRPLVIGPLIAAAGFALFARPGLHADYWRDFFPAVVVLGLGMTVTVAPLTTTVMNAVGPGLAGVASGVNNAVSRTASLLALALFGLLMAAQFDRALADGLSAARVPSEVARQMLAQRQALAGIELPPGLDAGLRSTVTQAVGAAFVSGFRLVMACCVVLALASSLCAAWLIGRARR